MVQTETYFGNYLGIVIRNDDPEGRGRVKVFIPHISVTLYKNWNEKAEDKIFNFMDEASKGLGDVLEDLSKVLPWAEQAAPLIGSLSQGRVSGGGSGTLHPGGGTFGGAGGGSKNIIADGNQHLPVDTSSTPSLQQARSQFASQLQNPAVKNALFTRANQEVGSQGPAAQQAWIESALNRAACRHMSVMGAVDNHDGYYGHEGLHGTPGNYDDILNAVMNGSNISDFSTGNASGGVGVGELRKSFHGEDFGIETPDAGCMDAIMAGQPIPEKPARAVEKARPTDGHVDSMHDPVRRANAYGNEYAAHAYSNVAKGVFSIPNTGAHIWCFFHGGDPMRPVYFAGSFGATDVAGVRAAGSGQQDEKLYSDENSKTGGGGDRYRGNLVLNERGGAFEIINTEGRELMSLVGYHGNNLRMGEHLSMYSANNFQTLVAKDFFHTVNHDRNEVVRNHYDLVVYGDIHRKIGHTGSYLDTYKKIYNVIKPTHDKIALYEKKRADAYLAQYGRGSTQQSKSGTPAKCPVCSPGEQYTSLITTADTLNLNGMSESSVIPPTGGEKAPTITKGTSQIQTQTWGSTGQIFGSTCLTCGGSGESPSSEQGQWESDQQKEQAAQDMVNQIDQLADLEAQLGPGGSEIVTVAKDYTVTVGLLLNDMAAVRTDVNGKLVPRGMKIGKQGIYRDKHQAPILEVVPQHPAFPGGNLDLTVMNRYNVMVGSGGIFLKTKGVVQMGGTLTNLNGDQILITSVNETKITGGKSFSVAADLVTLAPNNAGQVMIDGGLAVARNLICAGGLHVEGELSCHHISAPLEYQYTELHQPGGTTTTDYIIGYVQNVEPGSATLIVRGGSAPGAPAQADCITVDAHRHVFANLPLSLMSTSDDVRSKAMGNNNNKAVTPKTKYTAGTATVPTSEQA